MSDSIRRQHRFTITPEHLILDPRVSDRAMRLWCRLDRYAGDREVAFPSRETLAIDLDCSPASVDRAVKELCDAGWLKKERRNEGDVNEYVLIVAPEKATQRLIDEARKVRIEATQPRREKAKEKRREQKRGAKVQPFENAQVSEGGVVTSDDTLDRGGVVTSDETPVVTGDERGVVTHDEEKEATLEGSIIEGHPQAPSLRSTALTSADASAGVPPQLTLISEVAPAGPQPSFEDFYAIYPKHEGKQAAKRAWDKATVKNRVSPAEIMEGVHRYATDPNRPGGKNRPNDKQYVPQPATWLNKGSWADEPAAPVAFGRGRAYDDVATWGTEQERIAKAEAKRKAWEDLTPEEQEAELARQFGDDGSAAAHSG